MRKGHTSPRALQLTVPSALSPTSVQHAQVEARVRAAQVARAGECVGCSHEVGCVPLPGCPQQDAPQVASSRVPALSASLQRSLCGCQVLGGA